jgi:chemotaxis protein CheX
MSECDIGLKTDTVDLFLSTANSEHVDASVSEVFSIMFGFEIEQIQTAECEHCLFRLDERTAIVGISGTMRGSFQIRIGTLAARTIASAMLGGSLVEEDDGSIDDALGELCNMIAGGWKNSFPVFSESTLSPPTVVSGQNYKIHFHKPSLELSRSYKFDNHILSLTVYCELSATI